MAIDNRQLYIQWALERDFISMIETIKNNDNFTESIILEKVEITFSHKIPKSVRDGDAK